MSEGGRCPFSVSGKGAWVASGVVVASVVGVALARRLLGSQRSQQQQQQEQQQQEQLTDAVPELPTREELQNRITQLETERAAERAGRTKAEMRLHEVRMATEARLGTPVIAIGKAVTPFPDRFGTPRQGLLVPDAVGRIELDTSRIQGVSLDGLQEHSHVWVSFLFHTNTNTVRLSALDDGDKPAAATTKKRRRKNAKPKRKVFPAKVAPPALGGRRVGVFSTRSPHRPNPVGLTLLRLEGVDLKRGVLHVSGLDLVNGTPIIDIKPYMPPYDSQPDATCPDWVTTKWGQRTPVEFAGDSLAQLKQLQAWGCLKLYGKEEEGLARCTKALVQALALDMRSAYRGRGEKADDETRYRWDFDGVTVCWTMREGTIVVTGVEKKRKTRPAQA